MDYQNEEIEEVILDENEVAEEETDSIEEEAPSSAQHKQMKNVAAKKGMAEEEEEEETSKVANTSPLAKGSGKGKFAGLYKDGTGKGAIIPDPVDVGAAGGDAKSKFNSSIKSKKAMREDVDVHMTAMFDGEELSENFKTKASTIFEVALNERTEEIRSELEEEYSNRLTSSIDENKTALTEQLDSYLSYVIEEWLGENRIAIEKGIRTEVAEEFMSSLRNLFLEHDINVPENKIDLADQMAETAENLKTRLDEEIMKNVQLTEAVKDYRREQILDEMASDLTVTQKERFRTLTEGVTFSADEDDVRSKLEIIKESYFSGKPKLNHTEENAATAEESIDEVSIGGQIENLSESMKAYTDTLRRIAKR